MARSNDGSILRHLRWVLGADQAKDQTDCQLLQRFLDQRDEAAFTALVHRHGRLVLGACRRVLNHAQDAEDVFQATFLILARKAKSIRRRESIGSWLYQTARRLALRARTQRAKQHDHESLATELPQRNAAEDVSWREVRAILDEELMRLADKHRAPVLLCYFEGRTQEDAALQLGWPLRTLQGRLVRARELLRRRLVRRGLPVGSTLAATVLGGDAALASLPAAVAQSTCQAAALWARGESIDGMVSKSVTKIVEGALLEMATIKVLKLAFITALMLALLGGSVSIIVAQASSAGYNQGEVQKGLPLAGDQAGQDQKADPQAALPPLLDARGDELPAGAVHRLGTQRLRHGGGVMAVAWSADSSWIASGGMGFDLTVRLWDAGNGKAIRSFAMHRGDVRSVSFAPNGSMAASVDNQGMLYLWQTLTGKAIGSRRVSPNATVSFAADGKGVASIDEQGQACLIEATPKLATIRTFRPGAGLQPPLACLAWSSDGQTLATANTLKKVVVFNVVTGLVRLTLENDSKIDCLSLTPDGKMAAVAGPEKTINLWDTSTGKKVGKLEGHLQKVKALTWSPDGKTLASGSDDQTVRLWDVQRGTELVKFAEHRGPVDCVAFSPDGKRVASGSYVRDYSLQVWEVATGKPAVAFDEHYGGVRALAVLNGGKTLLTSGNDPQLRLWDLQTGQSTGQFLARRSNPKAIAVSPDSKLLAVGADDGGIRLLALPTGKEVMQLKPDNIGIRILTFSPDGKWLASSNSRRKTLLWEVASGQVVREFKDQPEEMIALAFSTDSVLLCTANRGAMLRVFDVATGLEVGRLSGHTADIEPIHFFPNSQYLASVSMDSSARVWDLSAGKEVRRMDKLGYGYAMDISPDGRMLVTGGGDKSVRLWEVATGKQRAQLEGHNGGVASLAFLPDGKTLVSGATDSTVLCWDLTARGRDKQLTAKALTAEELETAWHQLFGDDAAKAYRALLTLAEHPQLALGKLQTQLRPAAPVDAKLIAGWLADLEDAKYPVREKAAEELKKVRDVAWPALTKALENPSSLEAQNRVRQIMGKWDDSLLPHSERLRQIRSLELLERLDLPGAAKLIQMLAGGASDAWLTQETQRMVKRRR